MLAVDKADPDGACADRPAAVNPRDDDINNPSAEAAAAQPLTTAGGGSFGQFQEVGSVPLAALQAAGRAWLAQAVRFTYPTCACRRVVHTLFRPALHASPLSLVQSEGGICGH
jgi:hypothetical protein